MLNEISLTVRLPHVINLQLHDVSKKLGMTKTSVIRIALHEYLTDSTLRVVFTDPPYVGKRDRIILNVNQSTLDMLNEASKKYNQSMNSIVTAACILILKHYSI